jgi:heme/copper-type cytochrome/quinol oxidase subunit 2
VVLATVVGLGAALLALRPWLRRAQAPNGSVVVLADMAGFRPQVIRARTGQPITLRLESLDTRFHTDGGGRHQLAIDELGINLIAPPLGAAQATLVVSRPGTYRFYCGICCGGKANPAMWGRLIVAS